MKIGVIHATKNSINPMVNELKTHGDLEVVHFLDESLLDEINDLGSVSKEHIRRILKKIDEAYLDKLDGVALACSSFTPYVELFQKLYDFPIVSVDYEMLRTAVKKGTRIGIIATIGTAAETTTDLIYQIASSYNKTVTVDSITASRALQAFKNGDYKQFSNLIREQIDILSQKADVIVVAQISIVEALTNYKPARLTPILNGGEHSIKELKSYLFEERAQQS